MENGSLQPDSLSMVEKRRNRVSNSASLHRWILVPRSTYVSLFVTQRHQQKGKQKRNHKLGLCICVVPRPMVLHSLTPPGVPRRPAIDGTSKVLNGITNRERKCQQPISDNQPAQNCNRGHDDDNDCIVPASPFQYRAVFVAELDRDETHPPSLRLGVE
ncbi:hypothetical protein EMCG_06154 [[Emmonsia] crescens]|uniref:Uncharacterized protein n=1 Tax=[Emmonsia] crescens TaxID=73230 RepID=A0A0G2ICB4_9EURO|nr:hypothetical protein EMCG_06154 [Emmonsia crescens UAMH 3008]